MPQSIVKYFSGNTEIAKIDKLLWDYAQASLFDHSQNCTLPSNISIFHSFAAELQWTLLNRIRYLYVFNLKSKLGSGLIVWGDDWIRLRLPEALPSSYLGSRLNKQYIYNRLSLDLGGNSCHSPLYPRLSDIFRAGGLPLQALMPNSVTLNWLQFNSLDQALEQIDNVLSLSEADYRHLYRSCSEEYAAIASSSMDNLADSIIRLIHP